MEKERERPGRVCSKSGEGTGLCLVCEVTV